MSPKRPFRLRTKRRPAGLGPEDYGVLREVIAAVRQALPDADQQQPNAVLTHVLSALRQVDAKTISDLSHYVTSWAGNAAISGYFRPHADKPNRL